MNKAHSDWVPFLFLLYYIWYEVCIPNSNGVCLSFAFQVITDIFTHQFVFSLYCFICFSLFGFCQ